MMRTQFNKDFIPFQQKGRIIPVHLQERVEGELNKKDQTIKLALHSKKINKFKHKNRYQIPNIDLLLEKIAHVVRSDKSKQTLFSKLDLRYAYLHIPLDKRT